MRNKKRSFTLVEVSIVACLFAVVGLVVIATFSSGVKIWNKVYKDQLLDEVSIFFDQISLDLRNVFYYEKLKFAGEKERIRFPSYVVSASGAGGIKRGVGEVIYYWDEDSQSLFKEIRNISNIYRDNQGLTKKILGDVHSLAISYYFYDAKDDKFSWSDEWQDDEFPLAVAISVSIGYENKISTFKTTVSIPLST